MKKKLVTVDNLEEYVCRTSNQLHADSTMILTAGAKDELTRRGIALVYGSVPADLSSQLHHSMTHKTSFPGVAEEAVNMTELLLGVAAILKKECGVTDPQELKALSLQAIKTIKDNI